MTPTDDAAVEAVIDILMSAPMQGETAETAGVRRQVCRRYARRINDEVIQPALRAERERVLAWDPCLQKRKPGEPMFILLGRDSAAPGAMLEWCDEREREIGADLRPDTAEEHEHIAQVRLKAAEFGLWRDDNWTAWGKDDQPSTASPPPAQSDPQQQAAAPMPGVESTS